MCHVILGVDFQRVFEIHLSHQRVLLLEQNLAEQNERYVHVWFKQDGPIQSLLRVVKIAGMNVCIFFMFKTAATERIQTAFVLKIRDRVRRLPMSERDLAQQKVRLRKGWIECNRLPH